jgi:hypothetical protein
VQSLFSPVRAVVSEPPDDQPPRRTKANCLGPEYSGGKATAHSLKKLENAFIPCNSH